MLGRSNEAKHHTSLPCWLRLFLSLLFYYGHTLTTGIKLGAIETKKFNDGEVSVKIGENVRGKDVYIVQPTGPPVNDNVMELLLIVSALRRASAKRITAIIPYYSYGRQNQKHNNKNTPISASDIARMLECVGVDRVIAVDLHAGQIGVSPPRTCFLARMLVKINICTCTIMFHLYVEISIIEYDTSQPGLINSRLMVCDYWCY